MLNQNSFWGAYLEGNDLPYIFPSHASAKAKCRELATGSPGKLVWLLKLEVIGTAIKPISDIILDGEMK